MIEIYTDGSCKGSKVGAYGFVVASSEGDPLVIVKTEVNTTNQQMEMRAVLEACKYFHEHDDNIIIYTDSAYVHNCYVQEWWRNWQRNGWKNAKKEPVKNKEIWEELIPFFQQHNIILVKVAGHQGNHWNEVIDSRVQNAAQLRAT